MNSALPVRTKLVMFHGGTIFLVRTTRETRTAKETLKSRHENRSTHHNTALMRRTDSKKIEKSTTNGITHGEWWNSQSRNLADRRLV